MNKMSRAQCGLFVLSCLLSQCWIPAWTRSLTLIETANCASISQACFESADCCSSECHEDRHFCCVPEGARCLGEDGTCCSGFCDPDVAMCGQRPPGTNTTASMTVPIYSDNIMWHTHHDDQHGNMNQNSLESDGTAPKTRFIWNGQSSSDF
ncbi:hypothetical protein TCAL_12849 [Tigriopus californicus]|uniref:Granulins domain-containing protein n=1 Tax=Tigriopus californicus TaxID=6832 RepID=A0A553PM32_TIGCA|nr:uncharacterized protein LOC131890861 [Tigriopus californicus]TRY78734.1 hypothetical protein TCAL_12849 [Tigriopus californicus]|eukprot:TCALIF_12849-PA protein Name:"Protein of unknown function" AED:0.36 eAED:0.36 QI:57/1/0.66/1/0/0.33/3/0/151